ncbi:MAG: 4'-phosphopantetheinyl transferase superfamily protein [Ruminococcus sp.]|nr:4'-phosphopantetheinyl transferase superfamily protein [Ruminococcus sp.]
MVKIYIQNINDISLSELNISKLSPYRYEKFDRIIDGKSKLQSLAAGLMLNDYISDKEIKLNEYGKPFVENGPFFSLAHSGDYVALAVSDKHEVGCDIEELRDCGFIRMGKLVFTENEISELKASEDKRDKFFEFWTKKEAFIKCIGEGFHYSVKSLDLSGERSYVLHNNKKHFFKEYMHQGYKIMLCSQDTEYEKANLL